MNHTNGVGNIYPNTRVIGNVFIDCGDQGNEAGAGQGGVVHIGLNTWSVDTVMNATIANNTFTGTKGEVMDISINWQGSHALIGLTITDNQSYNGDYWFLGATKLQHSKVSGNYIVNACKANPGAQAYGIWSSDATDSIEFLNNTFINTVTAPNGMYQGIAASSSGDIIGFNKFVGMRHTTVPINSDNSPKVLCSQIMDSGWYDPQPTYADNTAALAGGLTARARYKTATGVQMVVY